MSTTTPAPEKIISLITSEEGKDFKTNGEVVGNYRYSIVFFPRGEKCEPGKEYRLELTPLRGQDGNPRTDKRGKVMYTSRPAAVEITETWESLPDGNIQQLQVRTDWRLQEVGRRVIDGPRPPAAREAAELFPTTRKELVFGSSVADTHLAEVVVHTFPIEQEEVKAGKISWVRSGERQVEDSPVLYLVDSLVGVLYTGTLDLVYPPERDCSVEVRFTGGKSGTRLSLRWDALPAWFQAEVQRPYPVCPCGRKRVGSNSDGYAKCESCRDEETCVRCNQERRINLIEGLAICKGCEPMARLEAEVHIHVPQSKRAELAAQAARLMSANALPGDVGYSLLKELLSAEGVEGETQEVLLRRADHAWLYFFPTGEVWASHLPLVALQILATALGAAQGNGLVTLVAWMVSPTYFVATQVEHKELSLYWETPLHSVQLAKRVRQAHAERQRRLDQIDVLMAGLMNTDFNDEWRLKQLRSATLLDQEDGASDSQILLEIESTQAKRKAEREELVAVKAAAKPIAEKIFAEEHDLPKACRKANRDSQAEAVEHAYGWITSRRRWEHDEPVVQNWLDWENLERLREFVQKYSWVLEPIRPLVVPPRPRWGDLPNPSAVPTPARQSNGTVATFTDTGDGRHFRCSACNGTHRVTKAEQRSYKDGEEIHLICGCSAEGRVRQVVAPVSPSTAGAGDMADQLAALRSKWGGS